MRRVVWLAEALGYTRGRNLAKTTVTIHRDGSADVEQGVQDLGTGARTMVGIVAAEELGLPLAKVNVRIGSTALPYGPGSGGSTTTPSSAPSVRAAAWQAKQKLAEELAKVRNVPAANVVIESGRVGVRTPARSCPRRASRPRRRAPRTTPRAGSVSRPVPNLPRSRWTRRPAA